MSAGRELDQTGTESTQRGGAVSGNRMAARAAIQMPPMDSSVTDADPITEGIDIVQQEPTHDDDPYRDVKEILRDQLKFAHDGYQEFAGNLGETSVDEEKSKADLEHWLTGAEEAGALQYYAEWLKANPGKKIYIAVSPNKVIEGKKLEAAQDKFGEDQLYPTAVPNTNYSDWYSDEELSGPILPGDASVNFVVFTDGFNLPYKPFRYIESQQDALAKQQKTTPGAYIPSYKDCVAIQYRLRQESDGALAGDGTFNKTSARLINLEPKCLDDNDVLGWSFIPLPGVHDRGQSGRQWSFVENAAGGSNLDQARFVAGLRESQI